MKPLYCYFSSKPLLKFSLLLVLFICMICCDTTLFAKKLGMLWKMKFNDYTDLFMFFNSRVMFYSFGFIYFFMLNLTPATFFKVWTRLCWRFIFFINLLFHLGPFSSCSMNTNILLCVHFCKVLLIKKLTSDAESMKSTLFGVSVLESQKDYKQLNIYICIYLYIHM